MSSFDWVEYVANLDNNILWELLDRRSLQAQDKGNGRYVPIPAFTVTSQYHMLAVGCRNPIAPPGWNLGCYVSASIEAAISVQTGIAQILELGNYRIPLNQFKLLVLPDFQIRPYGLKVTVPKWHQAFNFEAWWFNDPLSTDVQASLGRIENAINLI